MYKFGNEKAKIVLTEVGHMARGRYNLFRMMRAMMDGWKLSGNEKAIVVKKGEIQLQFHIVIQTKKGALFCAYLQKSPAATEAMGRLPRKRSHMTLMKVHILLGYPTMECTKNFTRGVDQKVQSHSGKIWRTRQRM